jgi:hypothetical protein
MANNIIGIRNNNVILPYNATTKRTKEVALTVTSAQAGWSTTRAVGIFYADSNGVWRMRFNITGSFTSDTVTTVNLTLTGITFRNEPNQAVSAYWGSNVSVVPRASAVGGNNYISAESSSTTAAGIGVSGDVELASEPTTYTTSANMEGVIAADVWVNPASVGTSGIVNNSSSNTAGTPIKGKTDGVAVSVGYVGEVLGWTNLGTSSTLTAGGGATQIGTATITLTPGVYLVSITGDGTGSVTDGTRCVISFDLASGSATQTIIGHPDSHIQADTSGRSTLGFSYSAFFYVTSTAVVRVLGAASGGNVTGARTRNGAAMRIA